MKSAGELLAKRTEAEINTATKFIPKNSKKIKIAFLYLRGKNTMLIFGEKLAGSLIAALGATNATEVLNFNNNEFLSISAEALIKSNPDVILTMTQSVQSVGGEKAVLNLIGIKQTNAGKHQRIIHMDQNVILSFGPNLGKVIAALVKAIYRN